MTMAPFRRKHLSSTAARLVFLIVLCFLRFYFASTPARWSAPRLQHQSGLTFSPPAQGSSVHHQQLTPNPSGICVTPASRNWTSPIRSERFPSIQERICHYMSVWYDPNFHLDSAAFVMPWNFRYHNDSQGWADLIVNDTIVISNKILIGQPFHVWLNHEEEVMQSIGGGRTQGQQRPVQPNRVGNTFMLNTYVSDIQGAVQRLRHTDTPLLAQFGDVTIQLSQPLPIFSKFRLIHFGPSDPQPIVWKLESRRHFDPIPRAVNKEVPWEKKRNSAIFRGIASGTSSENKLAIDYFENDNLTAKEACFQIQRCILVYTVKKILNATDKIDAGLTLKHGGIKLNMVDGVSMFGWNLRRPQMTLYKMIISAEGNDVASGLKWQLYSRSVVLMAPPTRMSYALEHLLEPWVHYVPLRPDYLDIVEKVDWVLQHDEEARQVSERATQFMTDLLYHPDAKKDNVAIEDEIVRRYAKLWSHSVKQYQEQNQPAKL